MRLTPVALGAAALAAVPLVNVVGGYAWAWQSALVLTAMGLAGMLARRLRCPAWLASGAMAAAALAGLAWLSGDRPGELAGLGIADLRRFAAPVDEHDGVRFLTVAGVAALGLVVDALVVQARRPALAGLPMLAVYTVPVAVLDESTSWWPFALGALGFVWLLGTDRIALVRGFGRHFGGDGRPAAASLAAAGRLLGLIGVAVAVALPFLLPAALPAHRPWEAGAGTSGRGDAGSVDLLALLSGERNRPQRVDLLEVTNVDDAAPGNLRLAALERLTSQGFEPLPPGAAGPVAAGLPRPAWGPQVQAGAHRADIRIGERFHTGTLPVYPWPTGVRGVDGSWLFDPRTQMVYSGTRTTAGLRYTVEYVRPEITPEQLRRAAAVDPDDPALRDVLSVPPNLVVQSLLPGLLAGRATELDRVAAIKDFFAPANHFVYDTTTGPATGGAAITDFLQNRRGFCTQYAAAFAWLLRAAGIPARVAIGFAQPAGGAGRTTTLTNHDLHAWTEVYFPGYGWLPFDATPPAATAPSPAPTTPVSATAAPGPSAAAVAPTGPGAAPAEPAAPPWALSGLLLALLAAPALTRARTRRRRRRAREAWAELLDTMTDYRIGPGGADTPRTVAGRLSGLGGRAADGVRALQRAEEHARYAARPLPAGDPAADDLFAAVRAVRAGLARRATRRARLRAAVLPPSVLRRWRARLTLRTPSPSTGRRATRSSAGPGSSSPGRATS
ncbi:transglutaminase TgpA family protein [Dactylosporangium matsuzakiense]|uniref:transglutaminase TgpA family protein n=1 Tax=Dactylosporangium matsuzakiense TaxID=53360 RepID=UPI0021C2C678|nr:DUF3488 and transglutaminase-like domain-containing protein [Dactylosporangium matsuzakiense]UWZ42400.1 transglutaminase domain-containing protein [Dactylosporangium matsuzakiense]